MLTAVLGHGGVPEWTVRNLPTRPAGMWIPATFCLHRYPDERCTLRGLWEHGELHHWFIIDLTESLVSGQLMHQRNMPVPSTHDLVW